MVSEGHGCIMIDIMIMIPLTTCAILKVDIPSEPEDDDEDPDGRFAFKRKLGVKYLSVSKLNLRSKKNPF